MACCWPLQALGSDRWISVRCMPVVVHEARQATTIAGLVVASNSAAGLVSGFVGGALSDRVGPRRVLSGSLVLMAVAFGLFPLIRDPWEAFGLNVLVGLGSGSFWPSQSTLLSSLTPRERRHAAFAQQRMTMNLGIAVSFPPGSRARSRPDRLEPYAPSSRRTMPAGIDIGRRIFMASLRSRYH